MSDTRQALGWWLASDGNWYPPEQHPNYSPATDASPAARRAEVTALNFPGLPPLVPEVPPTPTGAFSIHGSKTRSNFKWVWVAGGAALVVLLVGAVVMIARGSSSKNSTTPPSSPSRSVASIHAAATQFQQYASAYDNAIKTPDAAIAAANADIATQNGRIASDQTTYQNNEFGGGCNPADVNNYLTCVSQEQQTAAGAQSDQTTARTAGSNDQKSAIAADQQLQDISSTFIQQLDAIAWPTSTSRQDAGQLAQTLTDARNAVGQESDDLLNGLSTTQDNQTIASANSDLSTEYINLATALGIPPPPAPSAT